MLYKLQGPSSESNDECAAAEGLQVPDWHRAPAAVRNAVWGSELEFLARTAVGLWLSDDNHEQI